MSRKKILFVTYDSIKAPILHSQGLPHLKEFIKKGYECGIVTFESSDKIKRAYKKYFNDTKIKWHYLKNINAPFQPASIFDIIQGFFFVSWLIMKYKYNIIHCRSYIAELFGLFAAKIFFKKNIFDMRGLYPDEYVLSGYIKKGKIYRLYKFIEKVEIKYANKIVVVSNRFAAYIRRLYFRNNSKKFTNKVKVIYNAANIEKFNFPLNVISKKRKELNLTDKVVFVYSGSLAAWHLWKYAIDFFRYIWESEKDVFLLFLTYENKKIVEQYCRKKKLKAANYKILSLRSDEVPLYLSMSDIGLSFIYPDISKQVCFPIKFAEYLAAGLPVIINNGIGDIPDIIEKNNIGIVYKLSELKEKEIVVNKFRQYFHKYDLNKIKNRCKVIAGKEFYLSNAVEKYMEIYKTI